MKDVITFLTDQYEEFVEFLESIGHADAEQEAERLLQEIEDI